VIHAKLCNKHGYYDTPQCVPCAIELSSARFEEAIKRGPPVKTAVEADDSRTLARVIAFIRRSNADGSPCSAERECLARRIERGEHRK